MFVSNAVTPTLGLAGSICRPIMKLRGILALEILVLFFFCIESQENWLLVSQDPFEHSKFGSLSLQRSSIPVKIATALS